MINYILIAAIVVLAALAIHRMVTRGMCDCKGKKGKSCHGSCACSCGIQAEEELAQKLEVAAQKSEALQAQEGEACACGAHEDGEEYACSCGASSETSEQKSV